MRSSEEQLFNPDWTTPKSLCLKQSQQKNVTFVVCGSLRFPRQHHVQESIDG